MSDTPETDAFEPTKPSDDTHPRAFLGVPVEVLVSVGRARPFISDLVRLRRDSVLQLDSRVDDPVELYIGDRLIARGELQEMDGQDGLLGVRLTEVAELGER
jgi:flagellar motor switch protein FliN/FliY